MLSVFEKDWLHPLKVVGFFFLFSLAELFDPVVDGRLPSRMSTIFTMQPSISRWDWEEPQIYSQYCILHSYIDM
jgi:hypothetical protein